MGITDTPRSLRLLVADLDGTLLHDAPSFEERALSQWSTDVIHRVHEQGMKFAISTARPVSTGLPFAQKLPVDACIYLNGALIDTNPSASDYDLLTNVSEPTDDHLIKIGFSSKRACEVCLELLSMIPDLRIGIVMDDIRYTNFDVSIYWKTQTFRITDFHDVPTGTADKIIIFRQGDQWETLNANIPGDFESSISEGEMMMLMNPQANKEHSLQTLCARMGIDTDATASFGDDLIDIAMLQCSGRGVAVANAHPDVLRVADEICPANNDDGVAHWIQSHLL